MRTSPRSATCPADRASPVVPTKKSTVCSGFFHYFSKTRFCRLTSNLQKNDVKNDVRISAENPRKQRQFPRRLHRANMSYKRRLSPSSPRRVPYMPVCPSRGRRGYSASGGHYPRPPRFSLGLSKQAAVFICGLWLWQIFSDLH